MVLALWLDEGIVLMTRAKWAAIQVGCDSSGLRFKWAATQMGCDLRAARNTNARPPNGAGRSQAMMRLLNRSGFTQSRDFHSKTLDE
jgi:hypothetical protein